MEWYEWLQAIGTIWLVIIVFKYAINKPKNDRKQFAQKFADMGNLQGKTYNQIVAKVGKPRTTTCQGNLMNCEWGGLRKGYFITLQFDDKNKCLGVIQELWVR